MSKRCLFLGVLCIAILCLSVTTFASEKEHKVYGAETGEEISGEIAKSTISHFVQHSGWEQYKFVNFYVFKDKETYVNIDNQILFGKTKSDNPKSMYMQATILNGVKSIVRKGIIDFRKEYYPEKESESKDRVEKLIKNFNLEAYAKTDDTKKSDKPSIGGLFKKRLPF